MSLVGTPFDKLPAWIAQWSTVDPSLLSVVDVNKDGILQLGEMRIGGDIVVLATPEIGGLPYVSQVWLLQAVWLQHSQQQTACC
jgi:cation/acetate symporter